MTEGQRFGINGFTLKWIAIISMLIDHTGAVLFPQYIQLRIVGRLAFPIFCFLLAEGAAHTGNIRRYETRLLVFACLSEVPFDLVFWGGLTLEHQNVFFTLFLGVLVIEQFQGHKEKWYGITAFLLACLLAEYMGTDYGAKGVLFILCFYLLGQYMVVKHAVFASANYLLAKGGVQVYAGLAVLPMLLYNGRRGPRMKYFFYIFYPAHLLILYFIKYFKLVQ
ncbi:MAG: hypothetical protein HFH38_03145 [Lachnospiraceae bacterium]|jgi:hypothetical protein|nr:hypothetical protein [Lachnospiraceae bacterium]